MGEWGKGGGERDIRKWVGKVGGVVGGESGVERGLVHISIII